MATEKEVNLNNQIWSGSTHKTSGDLIFSASRVKLSLFHAYRTLYKPNGILNASTPTGVTEVKTQGWIPNSGSYTESYHPNEHSAQMSLQTHSNIPTPNPSPFIGLRWSRRSLGSNAWRIIEWAGRVSSCYYCFRSALTSLAIRQCSRGIIERVGCPCRPQTDTSDIECV